MALAGEKWDRGRAGERDVREWLKQQGAWVVPAADIENGGAPVLEGLACPVVLPDLLAAIRTHSWWVEVKTKSDPTFNLMGRRWEHGFQLRHWPHYVICQELTGIPGAICFYELRSRLVLLQSVDVLCNEVRFYTGKNMPDHQPHVFFPRDVFRWYDGPDDAVAVAQPGSPLSFRTLNQKTAPVSRQLGLFSASAGFQLQGQP